MHPNKKILVQMLNYPYTYIFVQARNDLFRYCKYASLLATSSISNVAIKLSVNNEQVCSTGRKAKFCIPFYSRIYVRDIG